MSVRILKELDFIAEAFNILSITTIEKEWENFIAKVIVKLGKESPFMNRIELVKQIIHKAKKQMAGQEESIKFYFGEIDNLPLCLADFVVYYENYELVFYKNANELKKHALSLSDAERDQIFLKTMDIDDSLYDKLMGKGTETAVSDASRIKEIIGHIMTMDITEKDRLLILEMYVNGISGHLDKVIALLEPVINILKEFYDRMEPFLQEFCDYWIVKSAQINVYEDILKYFGIEVEHNPLGIIIFPWFTAPSTIGISCSSLEHYNARNFPYYLRMGILFSDEYWITKHAWEFGSDELCQVMKVLGDRSKFDILMFIKEKPAYGMEIARKLNLSTATISHHMNALLQQGLVKMETNETKIYYSLNKENLCKLLNACMEMLTG